MISSKIFTCELCGYKSNRKYNLQLHKNNKTACNKRIKKLQCETIPQNVGDFPQNVGGPPQNVGDFPQNVGDLLNLRFNCSFCNKSFKTKWNLERHSKNCNGVNHLQCQTCKKIFSSRFTKYEHVKNVNCQFDITEDEKDKEIKELKERVLKLEKNKENTIQNITINANTYNHFNSTINYNNYDQLNTEHITQELMNKLYITCGKKFTDVFEETCRALLSLKENRSFFLPEGVKSNRCMVIKDGKELLKTVETTLIKLSSQVGKQMRMVKKLPNDEYNQEFHGRACGTSYMHLNEPCELNDDHKELLPIAKNAILEQQC